MSMERITGIDSEIALTALFATLVASYPDTTFNLYPVFKAAAISLLLLTLMRRMLVMQDVSSQHALLRITTHIMDPVTYLSILYLIFRALRTVLATFGYQEIPPLLFVSVGTFSVFIGFIGWELSMGSALQEAERVFGATADKHQGELIAEVFSSIAAYAHPDRVYGKQVTSQSKLGTFTNQDREFEDLSPDQQHMAMRNFLVTLVALTLPIIGYISLVPISGYLFQSWWLSRSLLLLLVMLTSAAVRLWYSNYGLVNVEQRNGVVTFFGDAAVYLIFSSILFG